MLSFFSMVYEQQNCFKMKIKNKITSLIFDLDGTLWDARATVLKAWNTVFTENGYEEIPFEKFTQYVGMEQTEMISNLLNISEKEAAKFHSLLISEEEQKLKTEGGKLYTGVKSTLLELKKCYDLFIVSNCQDGYIEFFLEHCQLKNIFLDYESAGRTQMNKMKNIELLINRNHIKQTAYIGDTDGDSKAARGNKIPFVFAQYGFGDAQTFNFVISKFPDLLSIFC